MPVVAMFNFYYFLYIGFALLLTVIAVKFLKRKSDKYRYWFIFGLTVLNLFIHVFKIFIPLYYENVDYLITKVTFENICAVSAILFPFLYFTKNKTLKDYMIMVGIASGIVTFLFPVDAMSSRFNGEELNLVRHAFMLENIRFYTSHFLIFLAPFLMMHFGQYELSIKRAWRTPLMLFGVLTLIFVNEVIITLFGWVPSEHLFDPNKRNPSFVFGTTGSLQGLGLALGLLVPAFLRINPWFDGGFMPVLWLIGPILIYGGLITLAFMLIYDRDNTLIRLKLKSKIIIDLNDDEKVKL